MKPAKWWQGTIREWDNLPLAEREQIAFKATGCQVAYCTWGAPVRCLHTTCRTARGELAPIELTKGILRAERESGWLRFMDTGTYETLANAILARAKETGIYDPWELPGGRQAIVFSGVMA